MEIRQRIAVILCLGIGLASSGLTVAQSSPGLGQEMSHADREPPGLHDFDFLFGHWQVHHRKLKHRLVNSHEWIEFDGTSVIQKLMGGYANEVRPEAFDSLVEHVARALKARSTP